MKRVLLITIVALGIVLPLAADITVKQSIDGRGLGVSGQTTGTTYIKGTTSRSQCPQL